MDRSKKNWEREAGVWVTRNFIHDFKKSITSFHESTVVLYSTSATQELNFKHRNKKRTCLTLFNTISNFNPLVYNFLWWNITELVRILLHRHRPSRSGHDGCWMLLVMLLLLNSGQPKSTCLLPFPWYTNGTVTYNPPLVSRRLQNLAAYKTTAELGSFIQLYCIYG